MKLLFRKVLYIAAIFIILAALFFGYNYAAGSLKSFVADALEKNFGAKLSIAHMRISFPLCLELKGIKINDTISVSKICVYPSPASIFFKKIFIFSNIRIIDPVIRVKKGENDNFASFDTLKDNTPADGRNDSKTLFYVSRIDVENGTFIYDLGNSAFEFVKIKARIRNPDLHIAGNKPSVFKMTGFIKGNGPDILSPLRAGGIITRRLMIKARLQIDGVAVENLGNVYENYLKSRIVKGNLNLNSRILVSKNGLKADCFCRINDIILKDTAQEVSAPLIAKFILGLDFRNRALRISNFQTNLLSLLLSKS